MAKIKMQDDVARPLVMAAVGYPHFIITQKRTKGGVRSYITVTEGFEMDALFGWLASYAQENAEFKKALADYVIELSKVI